MTTATRRALAAGAALFTLGLAGGALAQAPVKIGVIYPLSGNSASAGNYSKMAIEVGADVINNGNADLAKVLPLAKGGGLPGLNGATVDFRGEGGGADRRLPVGHHAHRQRHRRAPRHPVPDRRIGRRQPHRT